MATKTKKRKQIIRTDLAIQLNQLEFELGKAGLYRTMHKVNDAKRMIGYEMAGTPELYHKMEILRLKRGK